MSEPQIPSQQGELPPPASPSPPGDLAPVVRAATRWRGRRWLVGIGLLFIVLTASGLLWLRGSRGPSVPPDRFPLPPLSSSPFRNTGAEAHYVGSESCKSCHQARTASFRRTGMGCSMAEIDPMREPADAVFDHVLSKRRYQVTRKDGQLWHRELLLSGGR